MTITDTAYKVKIKIDDLEAEPAEKMNITNTLLIIATDTGHRFETKTGNLESRTDSKRAALGTPIFVVTNQTLDQDKVQRILQAESMVHKKTGTVEMHHDRGPI